MFGLGTIVFMQFSILGLSFLLPNYTQLALGAGQAEAGSVLLFGCAVGAVMSPISGRIYDRLGARTPILTGLFCSLVAALAYTALTHSLTTLAATGIYVLFAFGQGMMYGTNMTSSLSFLPADIKADGNAMFTTLQQLAGAVGTSVAAAIVNAAQTGAANMSTATVAGTQNAFIVLAVAVCCSIACAHLETRGQRRK